MTTNPALRTVLVIVFLLCSPKHARPQSRTQQQTRTQQQSQTQETPAPPNCAAGIAFTNPETSPLQETKDLTPQGDGKRPDVILLQILTTTGNPLDECLPGMINLNVTFFDVDDNPICSGSVPIKLEGKPSFRQPNMEVTWASPFRFSRSAAIFWRYARSTCSNSCVG